ncbi:MAG: ATP-binding cassette domain-containing protein [Treponema sp.]|nr:ATP-binding cassette domain-containing protein [Treponema sp.]
MNVVTFNDVSFSYPGIEGDVDENGKQIPGAMVFDHFSAEFPNGFVNLVGPNASGKSTFMLLASGRILPSEGKIWIFGKETSLMSEQEKNETASFVYQNMEFDTDDKVCDLLNYVYSGGAFKGRTDAVCDKKIDLLEEIKNVFELVQCGEKKLNNLSKGEMQRVIAAFSLLYGSKSVFMDEPFFACEDVQKDKFVKYLRDYCKVKNITVYVSMHELELTKKYAETVMLFYPNHDIDLGTPEEVMSDKDLEKAYGIPVSMLKHAESMTRNQIKEESDMIKKL